MVANFSQCFIIILRCFRPTTGDFLPSSVRGRQQMSSRLAERRRECE